MIVHADDFGITVSQARAVLDLSSACDGQGALNSVSIFANSPAFEEAAALARPFVGKARFDGNGTGVIGDEPRRTVPGLAIGLHVNLVEGPCCADPALIPLLVDGRGMFRNDFVRLLLMAAGPKKGALRSQVETECGAQIDRFLKQFPELRLHLHLDSHQHVHAIPVIFEAMLSAAKSRGAQVTRLRIPSEPLAPHRRCGTLELAGVANRGKAALLTALCHRIRANVPSGCATPVFCGVVLSGHMSRITGELANAFEDEAHCFAAMQAERDCRALAQDDDRVEMLFHPVSVPVVQCLDPKNASFALACASPERDAEAETIRRLSAELGA